MQLDAFSSPMEYLKTTILQSVWIIFICKLKYILQSITL